MTEMKRFFDKYHNEGFTWKDSLILILLSFVACFVAGTLVGVSVDMFFSLFVNESNRDFVFMLASYFDFISYWIVFILVCLIFKSWRPMLRVIGPGIKGNTVRNLLLGLAIGFGLNSACVVAAILHKDIILYFDSFPVIRILLIFVAVFVQSSAEELMCRGLLYQRLRKTYRNPWVAILVNPLVFAALHLGNDGMNALAFANIYIVGVMFGVMVYYLDSLWMAMAAHAAWNFSQNIIYGLPNSGIVSQFSIFKLDAANARGSVFYHVAFGVESTVMAFIVLSIGTAIIIWLGRKKHLQPTEIW